MHKHRTVQILGIVIIAAALVYLVLGVIGAISLGGSGLGEGWSSGWRGWLTIPIFLATCLGFVALLVFGALLYFLAKIDANLAEAQQRFAKAAAQPAAVVAPVPLAAGVVAAEQPEPTVEAAAPEVAAPVAAAAVAAGVVAAAHHEKAVEVAAPEADVVAPTVEAEAPVIAAAATAGVVAAKQQAAEVEVAAPEVEMAAPAVEVETPMVAAAAAAAAAAVVTEEHEQVAGVEVAAPAVVAATAPAVDDTEALRAQIAALQAQIAALDSPEAPATVAPEALARLPGTDEAARIAAEMAALKPPKA